MTKFEYSGAVNKSTGCVNRYNSLCPSGKHYRPSVFNIHTSNTTIIVISNVKNNKRQNLNGININYLIYHGLRVINNKLSSYRDGRKSHHHRDGRKSYHHRDGRKSHHLLK